MRLTLTLTNPVDTSARGRNGWFTPREIEIVDMPMQGPWAPSALRLSVHAHRRGKNDPIVLYLTGPDAYALSAALIEAVTAQDAVGHPTPAVVPVTLTRRPSFATEAEQEATEEPQP